FVAVEDRIVTKDGKPQRGEVPVEMPEGVSYEGVFGDKKDAMLMTPRAGLTLDSQVGMASKAVTVTKTVRGRRTERGSGSGADAGSAGGVGGAVWPMPKFPIPAPPPPPIANAATESSETRVKLSPERKTLESKLHPSLLEAFDCAAKQQHDCKLVLD